MFKLGSTEAPTVAATLEQNRAQYHTFNVIILTFQCDTITLFRNKFFFTPQRKTQVYIIIFTLKRQTITFLCDNFQVQRQAI